MYDDAEQELKHILELVNTCPEKFQNKCFEILLKGYVDYILLQQKPLGVATQPPITKPLHQPSIPPDVRQRFEATARRLDIQNDKLLDLFDFSVDPFVFYAVKVPGDDKANQARNVALMVAAKSYLSSGTWTADWNEVKAQCVNFGCFNDNHSKYMKLGVGSIFKNVQSGRPIELSADGITQAEELLKGFVGAK